MDVLIPIETSSRELLYKVYLCHELSNKGFRCFLGNKYSISTLLESFKEFIYLDKGYHVGLSDKVYQKIKSRKGIIINLDEEGAVDFPDQSTLKRRYSPELFENSDIVFLWGEHQSKLINSLLGPRDNVVVTGHPRFELLKPEFHIFYQKEVNLLKEKFGDFILFNTNMGFGNNIKGDEFVITNYGPRFSNIQEKIAFDKLKTKTFIELIQKLSERVNKTIILRPHPEESLAVYQEAFKGLDNVKVIYEGSVVPWLAACNIMIHPDCTTSIESLFLNKKSIAYLPNSYDSNMVTELPLAASLVINKEKELIEMISSESYKETTLDANDFDRVNQSFSVEKHSTALMASTIYENFNANTHIKNKLPLKDLIKLRLKSIKQANSTDPNLRLSKNKLKGFDNKTLNEIHQQCISLNSTFAQVKCKKISDQLFSFAKN